jgi:hypothetical protein
MTDNPKSAIKNLKSLGDPAPNVLARADRVIK